MSWAVDTVLYVSNSTFVEMRFALHTISSVITVARQRDNWVRRNRSDSR